MKPSIAPGQFNIFGGIERARDQGTRDRREPRASGYVARPGSGPDGESCGTCANCRARQLSKTYYKCALNMANWTGGRASDVLLRSPACSKWIAGEPHRTTIAIGGRHE